MTDTSAEGMHPDTEAIIKRMRDNLTLPAVICSQGGVPYNNEHIEYWKRQAAAARAERDGIVAERNNLLTSLAYTEDALETATAERDLAWESAAWWKAEAAKSEAALKAAEAKLAGAYEECAVIADKGAEEGAYADEVAQDIRAMIRQRAGTRG